MESETRDSQTLTGWLACYMLQWTKITSNKVRGEVLLWPLPTHHIMLLPTLIHTDRHLQRFIFTKGGGLLHFKQGGKWEFMQIAFVSDSVFGECESSKQFDPERTASGSLPGNHFRMQILRPHPGQLNQTLGRWCQAIVFQKGLRGFCCTLERGTMKDHPTADASSQNLSTPGTMTSLRLQRACPWCLIPMA